MFRHSLRTRVLFAFGLFAALLGITSGFGTFAAMVVTEDRIVGKQLRLSVTDYIDRSGVDPDAPVHRANGSGHVRPFDRASGRLSGVVHCRIEVRRVR